MARKPVSNTDVRRFIRAAFRGLSADCCVEACFRRGSMDARNGAAPVTACPHYLAGWRLRKQIAATIRKMKEKKR